MYTRRRWILMGKESRPCRRAAQTRNRPAAAWRSVFMVRTLRDGYGLEQPGDRGRSAVALPHAMLDHGAEDGLNMFGNNLIAAGDQCPGACSAQQSDGGARR